MNNHTLYCYQQQTWNIQTTNNELYSYQWWTISNQVQLIHGLMNRNNSNLLRTTNTAINGKCIFTAKTWTMKHERISQINNKWVPVPSQKSGQLLYIINVDAQCITNVNGLMQWTGCFIPSTPSLPLLIHKTLPPPTTHETDRQTDKPLPPNNTV